MTWEAPMEWIAAVITVACFGGCATLTGRSFTWRPIERKRVLIALDDDRTIEGILWQRRGPLLVVRSAVFHRAGERVEMAGEVVIERHRVMWLQVVT